MKKEMTISRRLT